MNELEKEGYKWAEEVSEGMDLDKFVFYIEYSCYDLDCSFDKGALKFLEEYKAGWK